MKNHWRYKVNKIVLAQIDTVTGDIENNTKKISDCIIKAKNENADLIIFPEFALTGFPFGDILIRHKSILTKQVEAIKEIEKITQNITALVGFVDNSNKSSIILIQNGKILLNQPEIFEIKGHHYGIINEKNENAINNLMSKNPDTVIDCSCVPSRCFMEYIKNSEFTAIAKKYGVNYIFVNKVGYADNFSYFGASRIYDKQGNITLRAKYFEEDFVIADNLKGIINELPAGADKIININNFELNYQNDLDRTYKSIVFSIKQYFQKNGFTKAVLGLSGGLDSSVCAVLLADALGKENVFGISMPSNITSKESKNDAYILAKNLGITFLEVPLSQIINRAEFNEIFENINTERIKKSTTMENLQARTRATILWSISNEYKEMLPIATSDKSEAYIGYATVNGDMSGGFAPIADVTKTKLFALADFLNKNRKIKNVIPQSVLEKPPGAELKINPLTGNPVYAEEDNMPYEFLDEIIWYIENKNWGREELLKHLFLYEKKHTISFEQKVEWINKFFCKLKYAVFKWHIMPPSVIIDINSINSVEYHHPIISVVY